MSELGTPAYFARKHYLRDGKVHEGSPIIGTFLSTAALLAAFLGGAFLGMFLGSLIGPTAEDIVGFICACLATALVLRIQQRYGVQRYGVWSGECPHCSGTIAVTPPAEAPRLFDCPLCKGRTLLDKTEARFQVHRPDDQVATPPNLDAAPEKEAL
jgi:hypothetical protein